MNFKTRFAPSPTGPLHLGHAYSALLAQDMALAADGTFMLRIEDIDQSRARPEWEAQIYDDLKWLGLSWQEPVLRQSDRMAAYTKALHDLWDRGLAFQCTCNRRDIEAATSAPQEGGMPLIGPDGLVYPGTCRGRTTTGGDNDYSGNSILRLNIGDATKLVEKTNNGPFHFHETGIGPNGETGRIEFTSKDVETNIGDIVLARRDMGTSYHLSVVLDDAAQGITDVVRGQDLFEATKIHVVLQRLLGLPTPLYHHHKLIRDENGKRLAKRDDARAISKYRADGLTPDDIRRRVGL